MNRRRRGTALLETALCLPLLVLMLGWTVDAAWLALVRHQLQAAAAAGTRIGLAGGLPSRHGEGVAFCKGGEGDDGLEAVRAGIAAHAAGVLRPRQLCLAAIGKAGPARIYALRYRSRPLLGLAPGWRRAVVLEARVVVHAPA